VSGTPSPTQVLQAVPRPFLTNNVSAIVQNTPQQALPPVDQLPIPTGQAADQCHSFGRSTNDQDHASDVWKSTVEKFELALIKFGEPAATELYDHYMRPGVISATRYAVTDDKAIREFANAAPTLKAYKAVQDAALSAVELIRPQLQLGSSGTLKQLGVGQNVDIDYTPPKGSSMAQQTTAPALIAGGKGSLISQRGTFLDRRDFAGKYSLDPVYDANGGLLSVKLRLTSIALVIKDSIDFCPGGLGSPTARIVTLPFSRLERTPYPTGGGWTQPVLWVAAVPLPDAVIDVSSLYVHRFPTAIHAHIVVQSVGAIWSQEYTTGTVDADYIPVAGSCPYGLALAAPCQFTLADPAKSSGSLTLKDVIDQCNGMASVPPWTAPSSAPVAGDIFFNALTTPGVFNSVNAGFGGQTIMGETCDNGSGGPIDVTFVGETAQNGGTWSPGLTEITMQISSAEPDETGYIQLTFSY
jgi:hypothetical protein